MPITLGDAILMVGNLNAAWYVMLDEICNKSRLYRMNDNRAGGQW